MSAKKNLRLGYLFERAARLKPSNLFDFAGQAKKATGTKKPKAVLILDMLWCSVRYELGFRDYAVWDFAVLNSRERKTWMTHPKSHRYSLTVNSREHWQWVDDKFKFTEKFGDLLGREWLDARVASAEEFAEFLRRNPSIIVKPVDGLGGDSIEVLHERHTSDPVALQRRLIDAGQVLVEALIVQHPTMAELYPGSVNTVRMITYLAPDDKLHILARVLRIGNGAAVDNFASGGMYALLDETGTSPYAGVDKFSNVYEAHPLTGVSVAGFQVPHFDRVLDMVEDAARRIPDVPYIGWDIAITAEGPALIEGNNDSSVFQTKPTVSGVKIGLLPVYKAAIGF